MSGVAKVDTALGCALVATILQADDRLTGTQLFIGEDTLVLFRFLWPDAGFAVFGHLGKRLSNRVKTGYSGYELRRGSLGMNKPCGPAIADR